MNEKTAQTVSVVMATYNGEKFIREQIDSILGQTYPVHELIIQDDGSTDQTVVIACKYAETYPQVKVFVNEKNIGLNLNFQTAAMRATGDFVAISDQDDVWYPKKIERQIAAIGNNDMCCSATMFGKSPETAELSNKPCNIERLLFFSYVGGHSMLCRRDFIKNPDNWQSYMWYDWSLSLHAALAGGIIKIDDPLLWHRYHAGEVSSLLGEELKSIGEHSKYYPYLCGLKVYRRWISDDNRKRIYTHLTELTADGRHPLVHRICQLMLCDDLPSILRLCRLCQKHRKKTYFGDKTVSGITGWLRGFFFPFIYSCTPAPSLFLKDMSRS